MSNDQKLDEIKEVLEENPCYHLHLDPETEKECVLCDIRKIVEK